MASATSRQLLNNQTHAGHQLQFSSPPPVHRRRSLEFSSSWDINRCSCKLISHFCNYRRNLRSVSKASPGDDVISPADEDDGVSLGTMKLPLDTDIPRFETLLFQWGNSLCQGANLPLPVPLKVDKIQGGIRLGFITIGDGETEVLVYIDCLVFPATDGSAPIFRAIRDGPMKDKSPPGEPRIMRSLLEALKKSVEIARV